MQQHELRTLPERGSLDILPSVGSTTDLYRIEVTGLPVDSERSLEVRVDIRRLGSAKGAIIFAVLAPGANGLFVNYNVVFPWGRPPEPLVPGLYQVKVTTPHPPGTEEPYPVGQFQVV